MKMLRKTVYILFLFVGIFAQEQVKVDSFLVGKKIKDFVFDKNKIWLATEGNGIFELSPQENSIKNYSTENNKVTNDIFFSIAKGGKYIFAGSIDGLFIFDKRKKRWAKRKFSAGGQLGNYIRSLIFDEKRKTLWIGRFQYLTQFNLKKRRFTNFELTQNGDNQSNSVTTMEIKNSNLWVGTDNGVFSINLEQDFREEFNYVYLNNRLNYFPNSGEKVSISSILFERNNIWFGCNQFQTKENPNFNSGGIYKFDGANSWLRIDKNNGLNGNGISDAIVVGNNIWLAVYQFGENTKKEFGRGLNIINRVNGKINRIVHPGLPEQINKMEYYQGSLWVASETGFFKMPLENKFFSWEK